MNDAYSYWPNPLGFMERARYHSREGRTASERYMDRRRFVNNPRLQSENYHERMDAWAKLGKFKTIVYPARATAKGTRDYLDAERECAVCGKSLRGFRVNAQFCSDKCRKNPVFMRIVRDNEVPSLLKREFLMTANELTNPVDRAYAERAERAPRVRAYIMPRREKLNFCPACRSYQFDSHSQVLCA